jgi:hypothetical protein
MPSIGDGGALLSVSNDAHERRPERAGEKFGCRNLSSVAPALSGALCAALGY